MPSLGLSILLVFVSCHSFRIKHSATSLNKSAVETPANPWNAFQKRYNGLNLRPRDFPILYRWKQRTELESSGIKEEDIVAQFVEMQSQREKEENTEYMSTFAPMTGAQVAQMANLDELAAKDLKTGIATVVGSPLAIARTLYSLIIWHIPQAAYSTQYVNSDGANIVSDFIQAFRHGSETLGLQGIEDRVRKWIEMLHDATSAYYDARGGATETFIGKWSYRFKGDATRDASKDAIKLWLNNVIHELLVLAGQDGKGVLSEQDGEVAEKWIPELSKMYEEITDAQLDGDLDTVMLSKPIDTGEVVDSLSEDSGVLSYVYSFFGSNTSSREELAEPETAKITNLGKAFAGEYLLAEFDYMQGTLEDLRICFIEIAKQLMSVKKDFKAWKKASLHGKDTPLKQANVEWAKSTWDDLGIIIPGDVSPQSKRLQDLHDTDGGILTLKRLDLDSAVVDNSKPGFGYELGNYGATAELQHLVIVNVKKFLQGGEMTQFMHLSEDIGKTAVMYMTSKKIPFDSMRPLTFEKVTNIGLYLPALSDVTGLSMETVKDSGTWYKKEMKASMVSMLKSGLNGQLKEEAGSGEPTLCELRNSDKKVLGDISMTHGTSRAFAEMALDHAISRL